MIDFTSQSGLSLVRAVNGLSRVPEELSPEQRTELVAEEAALLDFVMSFAHLVNSADLDAVVSTYADNCTVTSPRGQYVGTEAVRRNYGLYFDPVRWFSFWTNVTVRFIHPFDEAYVSAYQYSIGVGAPDGESQGAVSADVWRLKRIADSWKIAERRIDILDSHSHRVLPPLATQDA